MGYRKKQKKNGSDSVKHGCFHACLRRADGARTVPTPSGIRFSSLSGSLPLLRLRLEDHAGRAGAGEGDPGVLDRSLDERLDIRVIEV
jgi:hypothetical protein